MLPRFSVSRGFSINSSRKRKKEKQQQQQQQKLGNTILWIVPGTFSYAFDCTKIRKLLYTDECSGKTEEIDYKTECLFPFTPFVTTEIDVSKL